MKKSAATILPVDTENLHTTDKQAEVFVLTVFNSFNEPSTGTYGHACTARFSNINTVHCQNIPAEKKKKESVTARHLIRSFLQLFADT